MSSGFEITAADGVKLRGQCWKPETVRAAVCLVHGLGEHIGRYDHAAEAFNQAGIAVMGTDLRGHGNSAGRRGHTPAFDTYLDDLSRTLKKVRTDFPAQPLLLYGHSLGGLIALYYVLKKQPELSGVIASAPALQLADEPPRIQRSLAKGLLALRINPTLSNHLDDTKLSRDLNVVRTYRNDPLTHDRISASLAVGMIDAGRWCLNQAGGLHIPALLLHGGADQITSPQGSRMFAGQAGGNCSLKIWPDVLHEPHNAPGRHAVLSFIINWIQQL